MKKFFWIAWVFIGFATLLALTIISMLTLNHQRAQNQTLIQPVPAPQVIKGTSNIDPDFLIKSEFLTTSEIGMITDIVQHDYDPTEGIEIVVAGLNGAVIYDENLRVIKTIAYGPYSTAINIIDVESDNVPEFINRGSWGEVSSLINNDGNTVWTAPEDGGIDDMAAGDINGDSYLEFAVAHNGSTGVNLYDHTGNLLWNNNECGNVWHIEIEDIDIDSIGEIIHSGDSQTNVMDGSGNFIKKPTFFTNGAHVSDFSMVRWPDSSSDFHLVSYVLYHNMPPKVFISNLDSQMVAELEAPGGANTNVALSTLVQFQPDESKLLAVLVPGWSFSNTSTALLFVYDKSCTLIYTDQIPGNAYSIAVVELDDSVALLAGSDAVVYQYKINKSSDIDLPESDNSQ
jgi:hypothetical protein